MTESLADGPDWHLRSGSGFGPPLFSAIDLWIGSSVVSLHGFHLDEFNS